MHLHTNDILASFAIFGSLSFIPSHTDVTIRIPRFFIEYFYIDIQVTEIQTESRLQVLKQKLHCFYFMFV